MDAPLVVKGTDADNVSADPDRLAAGRPYLRRALALDPRPNAAAALALSLPGSRRLFDAGMSGVSAVEGRLAEVT